MEQKKSTVHRGVTIRAYRSSDLATLVALWYHTWHQTFPYLQHPYPFSAWEEQFREHLAIHGIVWLAEVEGNIAGFIIVIPNRQRVDQLFVDAQHQSQGIGALLLDRAKAICPQGLTLCTLQENIRARSFYERHGFKAGKQSVNPFNQQPNIEYRWTPSQ
ncbi:MAG: GNAT family N-acetyltransferase [Plectolyngbya sp. WJT66-NPBG17]|jgi:ribosomal protein S18 acetylase RimI-like enzyme|nr:GNAT family N-acetyltransferase [Plectolyngbya sp. WJT66-NPBG17]